MEFLPGSIDRRNNDREKEVLSILQRIFVDTPGVCGYRFPPVGIPNWQALPTFVLESPELDSL